MKIVIADGMHEADYIISMFNTDENELVIINEDVEACKYLSLKNDIPVMNGRCTRESELKEAGAEDCDLFIALSEDDYKTYVACKTAKYLFNAKRCVATVINPKNVSIFKSLGIDSVVCSTYLLGEQIDNISTIENMVNALPLEDDKVLILEFVLTSQHDVVGKSLADINISNIGAISSIIRDDAVIIPNGQTVLNENDKVLVVTKTENKKDIMNIFKRKV